LFPFNIQKKKTWIYEIEEDDDGNRVVEMNYLPYVKEILENYWIEGKLTDDYIKNHTFDVAQQMASHYQTVIDDSKLVKKKGEKGLFAKKNLRAGHELGYYYGHYKMLKTGEDGETLPETNRDVNAVAQSEYIKVLLDVHLVEGSSLTLCGDFSCHNTYLNHDREKCNVRIDTVCDMQAQFCHSLSTHEPPKITDILQNHQLNVVKLSKDVLKGEELLLDYDPSGKTDFTFDSDLEQDGERTPLSVQPSIFSPEGDSGAGAKRPLAFQVKQKAFNSFLQNIHMH